MNRRTIIHAFALLPVSTIVACGMQTPSPSQLASDVNLIVTGLTAAVASIKQIPGVPAPAVMQLQLYLTKIQADAQQIVATPAPSTVQEIGQVVQDVAAIALPLIPGGSVVEATVQAAVSLLPTLMAAIGVSGAALSTKYDPDQARLILAAAH